jgi:hypothetical protein
MIILSDNDVRGAVTALRRAIEHEWAGIAEDLDLRFVELEELGLRPDSPDAEVYTKCLEEGALLVTGDRSTRDGPDSLENVIGRLGREDSYPVITIADQVRLRRDRTYGEECAADLIDVIMDIDNYRGVRRIFLPFASRGTAR